MVLLGPTVWCPMVWGDTDCDESPLFTIGSYGACCFNASPYCEVMSHTECDALPYGRTASAYMGDYSLCDNDDCDSDAVPDECAASLGLVEDCDDNAVPDECDIANCPLGGAPCFDCDGNGVLDVCELLEPDACPNDCSGNGACHCGVCVCEIGWMGPDCSVAACGTGCQCDQSNVGSGLIGAIAGGCVLAPDGLVHICFDTGDLVTDAIVSITPVEITDRDVNLLVGPTPGRGVVVSLYDFEPDDLAFSSEQTATLTAVADVSEYNRNQLSRLDLYTQDGFEPGDNFIPLGADCCIVESPAGTFTARCTVQVEHFSRYGAAEPSDEDGDGVFDDFDGVVDNCPNDPNPDQESISSPPAAEMIGIEVSTKNRFLTFTAGDTGREQAVRLTFDSLPPPFDLWNRAELWVGPTSQVSEAGPNVTPKEGFPNFTAARLQCAPFYTNWGSLGMIHVFHEGIVPGGDYRVDVIDQACNEGVATSFSAALPMSTAIHGDTVRNLAETPPLPPEGAVNVVDALGVLGAFASAPGAIIKARADLEPACLDLMINVTDVLASLAGFVGLNYPFTATAADPCDSTCSNVLP